MPFAIACPNCGMQLAVSEAHVGQQGKCSRCGTIFTIETPRAASPVVVPPAVTPIGSSVDLMPGTIRVADGIGLGFTVLHANLGNFILIGLCFFAISLLIGILAAIPCIGLIIALASGFVIGPALAAGFYRACLKQCDGVPAEVGDLFGEFHQWVDYILMVLVQLAIGLTIWIPGAIIIGISLLPTAQGKPPIIPLLVVGVLVLVVCVVLSALALMFVLPALVDGRRGIGDALSTSWRLMMSNPVGLLGAVVLAWLLSIAGTLACCVGWIYTLPATFCMFAAIYRTAMPSIRDRGLGIRPQGSPIPIPPNPNP